MKCVVLQGDGMSDEPIADLNGKTALEAARTPNLDRMAAGGILGLARTIPAKLPAGGALGSLAVLGYDPARYRTTCGPLEAETSFIPCSQSHRVIIGNARWRYWRTVISEAVEFWSVETRV